MITYIEDAEGCGVLSLEVGVGVVGSVTGGALGVGGSVTGGALEVVGGGVVIGSLPDEGLGEGTASGQQIASSCWIIEHSWAVLSSHAA